MRKLVFEYAGANGFEMPSLQKVDLEKESSMVFATTTPKTVYSGSSDIYTAGTTMTYALSEELGTGIGS